MCGLFAAFSPEGALPADTRARVSQAIHALRHRGPDDDGIFQAESVVLGHRRLSIIDLSAAGHQPMLSDDGQIALVFNGQIYNWRPLRDELERLGHVFKSQCDTEVVLHAYMEFGERFVERLVGMWAIVIWDQQRKSLLVSRDRLGIKPLYVARDNGVLLFASEIKAILAYQGRTPEVNSWVLQRYITRGWLDDVPQTLYRDIQNFPAAGLAVWRDGKTSEMLFWRHPIPQEHSTSVELWRQVFIEVVADHIQSDAMLATTLSGGLDSTAINSVLARELGRARDVQAFSLAAPDIPDESPLIDASVRELGISHRYIDIGSIEYIEAIDELLEAHDEPTYSAGQVNQFVFRKHIGNLGYKVLLVGDGADEILAGYAKIIPLFISALQDGGSQSEAAAALHGSSGLTGLTPERQLERIALLQRSGVGRRTVQEYRFGYSLFSSGLAPNDAVLRFDKTHPNLAFRSEGGSFYQELMDRMLVDIPQVLRNEDRNGMASSIEIRPPFLDHRLYETSWSYPYRMMMKDGANKWLMREALKGIMPQHVLDNRKKFVRPGSITNLVYQALDHPLRMMLQLPSELMGGLWGENLPDLYASSRSRNNADEALVWLRYYMLRRTLALRFGDRDIRFA